MYTSEDSPMEGKSEAGWILAVVILLALIGIGYFVWASTPSQEPAPAPTEEMDTSPSTSDTGLDAGMDMTFPDSEEDEYQGIGEPPL